VVHIKSVNSDISELKERLAKIASHYGVEINSTIKDTVIVSYAKESAIGKIEELKEELGAEGKTIIITQQGL